MIKAAPFSLSIACKLPGKIKKTLIMSKQKQLNVHLGLTDYLLAIHCFCNILHTFVARKQVKYIFKFCTERAHRKTPQFSLKELVELRYDLKRLLGFFLSPFNGHSVK